MRPFRSLVAVATAATVVLLAAAPASAAPPEGCYGFPSIPSAFLCVVSFTPGNAVPGTSDGSTVTIPAFCAGDCYGPFTVPVPGVALGSGSGQVAVIVYNGQTYVVGGGGIPPLPPVGIPPIPGVPPVPTFPPCPGDPVTGPDTSPYVCAHWERRWDGTTFYVGTCVGTQCNVASITTAPIGGDEIFGWIDQVFARLRCIAASEC